MRAPCALKISRRGLSSLIAISDHAFECWLLRFRDWVDSLPRDVPVYEPLDLFVFQKVRVLTALSYLRESVALLVGR